MTIAVMLDFSGESLNIREGIFVFLYHLLKSWLEYDIGINIEIWVYSHSEENAVALLKDLMDSHLGRIQIYSDRMVSRNHNIKSSFLKIARTAAQFCTGCVERFQLPDAAGRIVKHKEEICEKLLLENKFDLVESFNRYSKADLCYMPFVTLKSAASLEKPAVIQVHDLFTFQFYRLFAKQANPPALYCKYNYLIKKNIKKYAKKDAHFVCSSEYTKKNQLLRFIPSIEVPQCHVIVYPPMTRAFHDIAPTISREQFRKKWKIDCAYTAFPSQNRPNKNLIFLLRALKRVNERGYRIKLVTTGRMCDVKATESFCRDNPDIVIETGDLSLNELYYLYKYSDMVVCPNLIEGLGISSQGLEALDIGGIPVIHAKTLGIEESLEFVGLDFMSADLNWVDMDDISGLADKIIDVLLHPELSVMKQNHIIQSYGKITWNGVAKQYMNLFQESMTGVLKI